MKKCKFIYLAMLGVFAVSTAQALPYDQKYWNQKLQIEPFRLPLPPVGYQVEYIGYLRLPKDNELDLIQMSLSMYFNGDIVYETEE